MAITFYKNLDDVCCAYNENIVKFRAKNSGNLPIYAELRIFKNSNLRQRYKITPLKENFYFNFKEPFKMLFRNVKYPIQYKTGSLQDYEGAVMQIGVQIYVEYENIFNIDSVTKNLYVLRSAEKTNGILSVMHTPTNNECHLTVWNGYPMNIAFFGKDYYLPSTLASDLPTPKQSELKAQLYCLSDGTSIVPENQFTWGQTKIFTYLKNECGIYLKWLNRYGGWDYHLFTNYTEKHKNQDIFKIQEYNQEVTTGKIVTEQIELLAGAVSGLELEKIRGILYSSHVYLYTGKKGQKAKHTDWQLVRLDGSTSINNLTHSHNLKFTINLPNKNTITL